MLNDIPEKFLIKTTTKNDFSQRLELSDLEQDEFPDFDYLTHTTKVLSLNRIKFKNMDNLLKFKNLESLIIDHADIPLPEKIGDLDKLERLTIVHSNVSTLPPSFNTLKKLKWLILDDNQISSIPLLIKELPNLYELSVVKNQITKLSWLLKELDEIKNLKVLRICENPLEPDAIFTLFQLAAERGISTDINIEDIIFNCYCSNALTLLRDSSQPLSNKKLYQMMPKYDESNLNLAENELSRIKYSGIRKAKKIRFQSK